MYRNSTLLTVYNTSVLFTKYKQSTGEFNHQSRNQAHDQEDHVEVVAGLLSVMTEKEGKYVASGPNSA
jgi:hypothetical protein